MPYIFLLRGKSCENRAFFVVARHPFLARTQLLHPHCALIIVTAEHYIVPPRCGHEALRRWDITTCVNPNTSQQKESIEKGVRAATHQLSALHQPVNPLRKGLSLEWGAEVDEPRLL
ncbi:hypothetical protein DMENIID0001_142000 [Sergentomyia squamirostris]